MTSRRAKVLTVSDGVVAGTRVDESGEALSAFLASHGFEVTDRLLSPDGVAPVSAMLRQMCTDFEGLIVTTGGTGFSVRDVTPEATLSITDRQAPGLAEAMRATSPLGRLSRGVAGTCGRCLIVNTPGSPKGCVEQLGAIIDVIPHALDLLTEIDAPHPTLGH